MKKIIYGALIAAAALTSCSLEEHPLSSFTEEEAYKSSTMIYVNCVAGVYNTIGNKIIGNGLSGVQTVQDVVSDCMIIPGRQGDWVDGGKWQNMFLHNFDPSNTAIKSVWTNLYSLVGLCNTSIDKLETLVDVNPDAQNYIYELRALRAMFYSYLLDMFAEIPVVTTSKVSMAEVTQSHRSQVFDFVVKELNEALPYLSTDQAQKQGLYYGRMTQAAAYMCLARLAINAPVYTIDNTSKTAYKEFVGDDMSKEGKASETLGANISAKGKNIQMTVDGTARNAWNTVIYCVEKIEGFGYTLAANYADNFAVSNENSPENIFVVPNDESLYRISISLPVFSWHYAHGTVQKAGGANGICSTIQQMNHMGYGTAEADAVRLKQNFYIGTDYTDYTNGALAYDTDGSVVSYDPLAVMVDFPAGVASNVLRQAGARYKKYEFDKNAASASYPNNDIVLYRYADALMMKAEAEYRLGNKDKALAYLNQVRERAKVPARTEITLETINVERACEFPWEAIRRTDQIRFATFTEPTADRYPGVWKNASASPYNDDTEGYTCVLPIPTDVLTLNPQLKQNPGF